MKKKTKMLLGAQKTEGRKMFQETWNKGQRWSDENQFGSRQGVHNYL
jgi:hypothetical protein